MNIHDKKAWPGRVLRALRLQLCVLAAALWAQAAWAQQQDTLFPYPTVSDDNATLTQRCNYLVYNFWERCNVKESFSSLQRLNEAFGTWASFMPYATADTVHLAIDQYIKSVEKQAPKSLGEVGRMAQNWFYCDTAQYMSEELYMPFCRAVAQAKKVPAAERARYQAQLKILESSSVGQRVPNIGYTRADGSLANLDDVLASRVILLLTDTDCFDCSLLKARLSADYNTRQLMDLGLIKIVTLFGGGSANWQSEASSYPETWEVGMCGDIDQYFDLSQKPRIYWLDGRHKVIGKEMDIDTLLYLVQQIYATTQRPNS